MNANEPTGLDQNLYIQASHKILGLLESAKAHIERIVDTIPSIFGVMAEDGYLVNGNSALASLVGCHPDDLLGANFASLFQTNDWSAFCRKQREAIAAGPERSVKFEMLASNTEHHPLIAWSIQLLQSPQAERYFSIHGTDVTTVRTYEEQLTQIFSNIPLGILRIDEDMRILKPYSTFTEQLLQRRDLAGSNFFDLVFGPVWATLSPEEREHANNLKNIIGFPALQFSLSKDFLLRRLSQVTASGTRVLKLNYEPLVHGDKIVSLLIILEDRSALAAAQHEAEARRQLDDPVINRFLAFKRLEPALCRTVIADLASYFVSLEKEAGAQDIVAFKRTLHSIKGTARVADLVALKTLAHATEENLVGASTLEVIREAYDQLRAEWQECQQVVKALGFEGALQARSRRAAEQLIDLCEIQNRLQLNMLRTATKLGKTIDPVFDFGQLQVPNGIARSLTDALLHLGANAIDHGIESPEERRVANKIGNGQIRITARLKNGLLEVTMEDDGRGINLDKVRRSAARHGLVNLKELAEMSAEEQYDLIFRDNLSTVDQVSEISGRGVGLAAVRSYITKMGGTVLCEPRKPHGTCFRMRIPLPAAAPVAVPSQPSRAA